LVYTYFLTYLLTYSPTQWSRVLLEKLTSSQLVKKLPAFYGTRSSLPHSQVSATCPYPESDRSSPCPHILQIHINPLNAELNPICHFLALLGAHHILHVSGLRVNIIIPSMPESSKWSLSLRFPHQNHVYTTSLPIHATHPAHLILLDLITQTILIEEYKLLSSSLCSFLHSLLPCFS